MRIYTLLRETEVIMALVDRKQIFLSLCKLLHTGRCLKSAELGYLVNWSWFTSLDGAQASRPELSV